MPKLFKAAGYALRVGGLLLLALIILPLLIASSECRYLAPAVKHAPQSQARYPESIKRELSRLNTYARLEDQTFLTLPEWYIVFSADEYGAFLPEHKPSAFPYFEAIVQYWDSYYRICAHTRDRYAFNSGYHVMLAVIGSSFTLEYAVKGIYENTIGRLAELTSSGPTEEEIYAARVAKEFGTFIHTIPWYDFPYLQKLRGLWSQTSLWGPSPIRKWERKLVLSAEYLVKAGYGAVLGKLSGAAYGTLDNEVYAVVESPPLGLLAKYPRIRMLVEPNAGYAVIALPHYEEFTTLTPGLLSDGLRFVEIGASDDIMISVIAPAGWTYTLPDGVFLLGMDFLTEPGKRRGVISVPVAKLHTVLKALSTQAVTLEHIYDY